MKIHFHDLLSQYIDYKDEVDFAIQKVLNSCQFIMGQEVFEFENALAQYLGCKNVISCASGTDALLLSLMAIGIKPGDEVITTPFTFISTAEVISLLGAIPVFADIQPDSYHIDPHQINEKITCKTRAIIPVSLYGQPADMDEINALAQTHGNEIGHKIYVIEDAAQSLGAEYKGLKSAALSDVGCVSFFPSKPLGCYGDGGAIIVKEDDIAEKIKCMRVHGQTKRYQHRYIGINGRLDTLQAAILLVKLKYFDKELSQRAKVAKLYDNLLAEYDIVIPFIKSDRTSVHQQYSIRVKHRHKVIDYLTSKQVPVAVHYPTPLHLQECFRFLGYIEGDFPVAERVSREIMSLPMSAYITSAQQQYIANVIQDVVAADEKVY